MSDAQYLQITGINQAKCTQCLECVKDCPSKLFAVANGAQVAFKDLQSSCIRCSHCIAVCPADAIDFVSREAPLAFSGISKPETLIPYDMLKRVMLARRSIRRFKPAPVEQDKIDKLLDLLRYAPSASNLQNWEYTLVTDPATRKGLVRATLGLFKAVARLAALRFFIRPFLGSREKRMLNPDIRERIRDTIRSFEEGGDPILYNAPLLLILHSPAYGHLAGNDAGIALTYAMFGAQSLGLGSCWIGFVQEMFFRTKAAKKKLGIPKKHAVWGVLALGYPDVKYHRTALREPVKAVRI